MRQRVQRFFDWLFALEEINGDGLCPTYLYRWALLKTRWGAVYLHHFVGSDWARDPHNHPKAFLSLGLSGEYIEHRYDNEGQPLGQMHYRAPWLRRFPPEHVHRIEAREAWTLIAVGPRRQEWGFYLRKETGTRWYPWSEYLERFGMARRDCA